MSPIPQKIMGRLLFSELGSEHKAEKLSGVNQEIASKISMNDL